MRRIRPRRLARNGLMEFRLWLGEVRTETRSTWRKRRHKALDTVDAVAFEVERLAPRVSGNRLARGLAATAVLAAGGAAAALIATSGGRSAGHPEAAAVRPAQPAAQTMPAGLRLQHHATHAARAHHAHRAPRRHHARHAPSAPTATADRTPGVPASAVNTPTIRTRAPRRATPTPPPPPRPAPSPSHHTGGGGQAVQFDSSG